MPDARGEGNRSRSSDLKTVRAECETRLRTLAMPDPFELTELRNVVERRRGRPIQLLPLSTDVGPFGLWVASPRADYIFFVQSTSRLHQVHIIVHELAHLLCDHTAPPISEHELVQIVLPDLQPSMVQTVLKRSAYTAREELEAEILASIILERAGETSRASRQALSNEDANSILARFTDALELG